MSELPKKERGDGDPSAALLNGIYGFDPEVLACLG